MKPRSLNNTWQLRKSTPFRACSSSWFTGEMQALKRARRKRESIWREVAEDVNLAAVKKKMPIHYYCNAIQAAKKAYNIRWIGQAVN